MNITTRSMSKRAGRKFIALDSEDEDPDYDQILMLRKLTRKNLTLSRKN